MNWSIEYTGAAEKDISRLDKKMRNRIMDFLDKVCTLESPRLAGKALTGEWSGFWRYKVSDFRIICRIKDETVTVAVVKVAPRDKVYRFNG